MKKNASPMDKIPPVLRPIVASLADQYDVTMAGVALAVREYSAFWNGNYSEMLDDVCHAIAWLRIYRARAECNATYKEYSVEIKPKTFLVSADVDPRRMNAPKPLGADRLRISQRYRKGTYNWPTYASFAINEWWVRQASIAGLDPLSVYPTLNLGPKTTPREQHPQVLINHRLLFVNEIEQGVAIPYYSHFVMTWGALNRLRSFGVTTCPGLLPIEVIVDERGHPAEVVLFKMDRRDTYLMRIPYEEWKQELSKRGHDTQ